MEKIKTLIIGGGVMGRVLAYKFRQRGCPFEVLDSGHSCAVNSMPFVSSYGIQEGLSPLGDLLVDSYKKFCQFYDEENPEGVEKVDHYILYSNQDQKLVKRFGVPRSLDFRNKTFEGHRLTSHLIRPKTFLEFLFPQNKITQHFLTTTELQKIIKEVQQQKMKIIFCSGALGHKSIEAPKSSKIVAGAYYELGLDLGAKSFIFTTEEGNLIYEASESKIFLGATSEPNEFALPDLKCLETIRGFYAQFFPELLEVKAHLKVGLRLKGSKRYPRMMKLQDGLILMDSLYKNGWSLPFSLCDKVFKLLDEIE